MRKYARAAIVIFCLIFVSVFFIKFVSDVPSGRLLFSEDFEEGISSVWKCNHSGTCPVITEDPLGMRGRVLRSSFDPIVDKGLHRSELALKSAVSSFNVHKSYWVGFSILLPLDWSESYRGGHFDEGWVMQFHDRSFLDPAWRWGLPLVLWHTPQGWSVTIQDVSRTRLAPLGEDGRNPIGANNKTVAEAPYEKGRWTDWVFQVKFSDASDGFVKAWKNGKLIGGHLGQNYWPEQTKAEQGSGPYFNIGIYQWGYKPEFQNVPVEKGYAARTAYYDEIKIAEGEDGYRLVTPRN